MKKGPAAVLPMPRGRYQSSSSPRSRLSIVRGVNIVVLPLISILGVLFLHLSEYVRSFAVFSYRPGAARCFEPRGIGLGYRGGTVWVKNVMAATLKVVYDSKRVYLQQTPLLGRLQTKKVRVYERIPPGRQSRINWTSNSPARVAGTAAGPFFTSFQK